MKKVFIIANAMLFMMMTACSFQEEAVLPSTETSTTQVSAPLEEGTCGSYRYARLPNSLLDIAAGTLEIYATTLSGNVLAFDRWADTWINIGGTGARRITTSGEGKLWMVDSQNRIYYAEYSPSLRRLTRGWRQMPGKATDIGGSTSGDVYILGDTRRGDDYDVYRWTGSRWLIIGGRGVRIAAGGSSGQAYLINSKDQIYRRSGSSWSKMPGLGKDIAYNAGKLYLIGNSQRGNAGYDVYKFENNAWCTVGGVAAHIAVSSGGVPVVVNGYGQGYSADDRYGIF